jgi:hypothetical protein
MMEIVPANGSPKPTSPHDPKARSWLEELGRLIGSYLADCDLKKSAAQPSNAGTASDLHGKSER